MGQQITSNLSIEEHTLWNRVNELWDCSADHDFKTINEAIHPNYVGWDNNSLVPHDRNYAIQSVADHSVQLIGYKLTPLGITVYKHQVGIANYRYRADISDIQDNIRAIKGRWTEIYIREENNWTLIGVHGGQESLRVVSTPAMYKLDTH